MGLDAELQLECCGDVYHVVPEEKFLSVAYGCMFDSSFKFFRMCSPACADLCGIFPLAIIL